MVVVARIKAALSQLEAPDYRGPAAINIALTSFAILALELAVIRWAGGQIRVFAYFNNLILIATFLGIGLGVPLGRRYPGLVHLAVPSLIPLMLVLTFSDTLGIMHLKFPDPALFLWGAESSGDIPILTFFTSLLIMLLVFWQVVISFALLAVPLGYFFEEMKTLLAYLFDLIGSLCGIGAFVALTALHSPPPLWFALGGLPVAWLSRKLWTIPALLIVLGLAWASVDGAHFSPYNRIDLESRTTATGTAYKLNVNRDFHQFMHDLSDAAIERSQDSERARYLRRAYDIPFVLNSHRERALVVGAGTGNDVAAALRNGYRHVVSVDIDPTIIALGKELHPERPYDDPRAYAVVNDARAFFETHDGPPFDVVCYGLLDSHAMFSSMSSLRLENFVYTVEGIRSAWALVAEEGHLSISFSVFAGDWISDRLLWTIEEATGVMPVVIDHKMHFGRTFVVARDPSLIDLTAVSYFPLAGPTTPKEASWLTTDDWPFLYVRIDRFPWGYLTLLSLVLVSGFLAIRRVYGGTLGRESFDAPMFFLGAGFLLLETRGITSLSLLFGMTWVVNAAVFSGVLVMAIVANTIVMTTGPRRLATWFIPLLISLLLVIWVEPRVLISYSYITRGLLGGLLVALPVGFAGVIVSSILLRSQHPSVSLGSNLLGTLLGGTVEYASMYVGLRATGAIALVFYLVALHLILRSGAGGGERHEATATEPSVA